MQVMAANRGSRRAKLQDPRAKIVLAAMQRLGLSYRWMGSTIGGNHVSVARWLEGASAPRNPEIYSKMLEALAEYEREAGNSPLGRRVGVRVIPIHEGSVMGDPSDFLTVLDWGTPANRWAQLIRGSAMSPLLEPGDIVVFEDRASEHGLVVSVKTQDGTVLTLGQHGNAEQATFVPLNQAYSTLDARECRVLGVAIEVRRDGLRGSRHTSMYPYGLEWKS